MVVELLQVWAGPALAAPEELLAEGGQERLVPPADRGEPAAAGLLLLLLGLPNAAARHCCRSLLLPAAGCGCCYACCRTCWVHVIVGAQVLWGWCGCCRVVDGQRRAGL